MINPYIDIIVRTTAVYLFMIAALRIFGKKELSQLSTTDIILIMLISNSVQNAMVGSDGSLSGGLAAATVLFLLNFMLRRLMKKSKWFSIIVQDKPEILIHQGKLDFKMLARLDISHDELREAMREHGVEYFRDVKLAILEPDGNISVITGDVRLRQTHYKRRKMRKNVVAV